MNAVCLQHEMDHLEGLLFIDHLSFFRRLRARAAAAARARSRTSGAERRQGAA
jgi:peptide deformylase